MLPLIRHLRLKPVLLRPRTLLGRLASDTASLKSKHADGGDEKKSGYSHGSNAQDTLVGVRLQADPALQRQKSGIVAQVI